MQFWTFENRGPKQPQTLMDAIEGVPVLVALTVSAGHPIMVKKRHGDQAFTVLAHGEALRADSHAANYKFIRYVDPQPEQPVVLPATLGVGEPYRLYKLKDSESLYWADPRNGNSNKLCGGYIRSDVGAMDRPVESATNIFAVLKTLD